MPFARHAPLRREIEARIPERPFTVEFWDGTRLPADRRRAAARPSTCARRGPPPTPCARPGQLGLGRAYVSGEIEVDDMDAVIELLDGWQPPPLEGADKRALLLGAVRAAGLTLPPPRPAAELRPSGRRHSKERDARAVRHHYDVSNEFFALFLDDSMTYSCAIFARRGRDARGGAGGEARDGRPQAGAEGGRPGARRRLRLGRLPALGGDQARRQRGRHHPLAAAGRESAAAGRGGRRRRPGRDPGHGLPRPGRRALRRDRQHRHGRARRRGQHRRLRRAPWPACSSRAGACSTTASPASATPTPRPAPSPSATSSPTPRRCTSRASCWRWNGPASSPATSRSFGADYAETLRHWARRLDENLDEAIRLAGPERVRVWRLYLRAARNGFESGFTSIYQARCTLG